MTSNLDHRYFIQWLNEYTRIWNDTSVSPAQLWFTFLRAKASFFVPNGSLELNLPSHIVKEIAAISLASPPSPTSRDSNHNHNDSEINTTIALNPNPLTSAIATSAVYNARTCPPPSPDIFYPAKRAVEAMLNVSLGKFVKETSGNADTPRRIYCTFLGIFTMAIGIIPTVCSVLLGWNRWWRLVGIPFFWQGIVVVLCSYASEFLIDFFFFSLFHAANYGSFTGFFVHIGG